MVKKKDISDILSLYETEEYSEEAKNKLKVQASEVNVRRVPLFSLTGFLSGVVKGITPWFFVLSVMYLIVVFFISTSTESVIAPLASCIIAPFLAIGGVGCLYFSSPPQFLELESACLYKAENVFAGKLILCGIYDLAVVILGSIISDTVSYTVMLSLAGFMISAVAVLSICSFFNVKTVIGLSASTVFVFVGTVITQNDIATGIQMYLFNLPTGTLAVILCLLLFSAILAGLIAMRNFRFERLVNIYET